MNHLSYKTSVKLAKFLGKSAPNPIENMFYDTAFADAGIYDFRIFAHSEKQREIPAFTLEDVLSKPFCAALANMVKGYWPSGIHATLADKYWAGGFAVVEREIVRLMGSK